MAVYHEIILIYLLCVFSENHAELTFQEGQNLLDQLSLPVKNAFGQDVTSDMRPQIQHVQRLLEDMQLNKGRVDEHADVVIIKLQQIIQLLICEKDSDQVCHDTNFHFC